MYFVYILKSQKNRKYYTGSTSDIEKRLKKHNGGENKSTKSGAPWKIIYQEKYETKKESYRRELQIKSYKGGNAFKKLLNNPWKSARVV